MSTERLTPFLVGSCPAEWKQPYIDEVTDVLTNGFVGPSLPHQTENSETGICYLQGFNVRPNKLDLTRTTWVTRNFHAKNPKSELREGDVLVVQSGHIGTAAVVPEVASGSNCHAVIICRFKSDLVDPDFASQYLNSQIGQARLRGLHVGSSLPHINTSELGRFKLPLPPLHEQKRLAQLWVTWDTAIQKTERLIAAKERHYSHELSRLISRGQHPHAHVGAFAEEVTARNRGGKPVLLGDFLTESRDADTEQNTAKRLTVRLHLQGVEARHVRGTESHGATTYFRRRAGQLIYGKQNIFRGAIGIIPPELDNFASTQDLPAFDIADDIDPQWLYFWLSRKDFYASLEALATGSGSKRLHPEEFLKLRVFVPDLATQSEIARYLHALREEIDLLGRSIAALKTQKRGLMQKLLTGQWRLPINDGAYE